MDLKTYAEMLTNELFDQLEGKLNHPLEVKFLEWIRPKAIGAVDGALASMDAKGVGAGPSK